MSIEVFRLNEVPPKPRKNVTTACLACRTAKSKCDGQHPCQECVRRNRQCDYGQQPDVRMLGKRAFSDLASRSELLDTLLSSLKSNDARANDELLEIIRSGATTAEIAQHALDMSKRTGASAKRTRSNVMDIVALTDQPLFRVPAHPWTDVTGDDNAVSHLFSTYLTWQHPCYPAFDPEIVIRELTAKQTSSQYCSKFLLNAMLATACVYTDDPAAFAEAGNNSSRGVHYFDQAMKLWLLEEGQSTLTNLQGLTIFIVCMVSMGKDRLALLHCAQLQAIRKNIHLKIRQSRKAGSNEYSDAEFQRSWSYAAWASFKIEVEMSMAWRTSFNITKPTVNRPYQRSELEHEDLWCPYPRSHPEITYNARHIDDAGLSLYVIGADICSVILSGNPQDSPLPGHIILEPSERLAKAHTIEQDLLAWQDNLSPALTDQLLSGPAMNLQLVYNIWRIEVSNIILQEPTTPEQDKQNAGDRLVAACKRIATLLQYGQHEFGLMHFPSHTMHSATVCANHLVGHLTEPQIPSVFHTYILTLTAVSHRWHLAKGITKGLWITIQQQQLEEYLQPETVSLFQLNAVDNWTPQDHKRFISCAYPNYATSNGNARDVVSIGDVLMDYAKLDINDTKGVSSTAPVQDSTAPVQDGDHDPGEGPSNAE